MITWWIIDFIDQYLIFLTWHVQFVLCCSSFFLFVVGVLREHFRWSTIGVYEIKIGVNFLWFLILSFHIRWSSLGQASSIALTLFLCVSTRIFVCMHSFVIFLVSLLWLLFVQFIYISGVILDLSFLCLFSCTFVSSIGVHWLFVLLFVLMVHFSWAFLFCCCTRLLLARHALFLVLQICSLNSQFTHPHTQIKHTHIGPTDGREAKWYFDKLLL